MSDAVRVQGLTKTFKPSLPARLVGRKGVFALNGVDLIARRGEIFGLLGPNGAGKSTLIKSLLGLVRPSGGTAELLGRPVGDKSARLEVGYLPEQAKFPTYLTGRQTVEFFAGLGGVERRDRRRRAAALLDRLDLTQAADRRVAGYSKGMKQKTGLAQALAGGGPDGPKLILLDEPTDGVDPVARRLIRDVLAERREAGACVFINSHLLGELEMICDRAAVLVSGRVEKAGTIDELGGGQGHFEIEIEPDHELAAAIATDPMAMQSRMSEALNVEWTAGPDGLPRTRVAYRNPPGTAYELKLLANNVLTARTTQAHRAQPVLDSLRRAGLVIKRFSVVRPTLEDLFIDAVTRQKTAGGPVQGPPANNMFEPTPQPMAAARLKKAARE